LRSTGEAEGSSATKVTVLHFASLRVARLIWRPDAAAHFEVGEVSCNRTRLYVTRKVRNSSRESVMLYVFKGGRTIWKYAILPRL